MIQNELFWDNEYKSGFIYGNFPSESAYKAAKYIIKSKINKPNTVLLEIGGGYGRNAAYFAENLKINVTVVDFSQNAINLGLSIHTGNNNPINFIKGDTKNLNNLFPDSSFDIIFHNFCLHLISPFKRKLLYKQMHKLLNDDGIILGSYLSYKDPDCPKQLINGSGVTVKLRGKDQHFFTRKEIRNELSGYFKILNIIESSDPEIIYNDFRNTSYYFTAAKKK